LEHILIETINFPWLNIGNSTPSASVFSKGKISANQLPIVIDTMRIVSHGTYSTPKYRIDPISHQCAPPTSAL